MADLAERLLDIAASDEAILSDHAEIINAAIFLIVLVIKNTADPGYRDWMLGKIADHVLDLPQRLGIQDPSSTVH